MPRLGHAAGRSRTAMLKFKVYNPQHDSDTPDTPDSPGAPVADPTLRNAYLLDSEGNGVRCEFSFQDGELWCDKRETGTAALALQHPAGDLGELTLQTCLLPEREEPYLLSVELARHRLMTVYNKLEDWAMFELEASHPVSKREQRARSKFIEALCHQKEDPARASRLADESLAASLDGSEELALAHSELLLNRRKESGSLPRAPLGCGVALDERGPALRSAAAAHFDYVQLPLPWKHLSPEENAYRWDDADDWVAWAQAQRKPVLAGPVISFEPACLPDWLYIWEHDYDTVRDLVYEHIEQVVKRYQSSVSAWTIVSGLHVNRHFTFNFEQLMDLTRMSCMLVKKLDPAAKVVIELRQPFGEYYARNARSIPPMMYVDLLIQSAIAFDAFGLRLPLGQAVDGQHARDLMQVSSVLDQFAGFGKNLFVTVAAPSAPVTHEMIASTETDEPADDRAGYWRRPWSEVVQGHWLEAALQIAMSKPFVEAVAWQDLIDHPQMELPLAGLLDDDEQSKAALRRLTYFRENLGLTGRGQDTPAAAATP
ncbi:MAG: endo-1,4-beta-xylanase [Planctomycetota bacterium]